jgi:hypothetical protein
MGYADTGKGGEANFPPTPAGRMQLAGDQQTPPAGVLRCCPRRHSQGQQRAAARRPPHSCIGTACTMKYGAAQSRAACCAHHNTQHVVCATTPETDSCTAAAHQDISSGASPQRSSGGKAIAAVSSLSLGRFCSTSGTRRCHAVQQRCGCGSDAAAARQVLPRRRKRWHLDIPNGHLPEWTAYPLGAARSPLCRPGVLAALEEDVHSQPSCAWIQGTKETQTYLCISFEPLCTNRVVPSATARVRGLSCVYGSCTDSMHAYMHACLLSRAELAE